MQAKLPKVLNVSVVVPAYEAGATLGACLRALRSAGFLPDEILVVDDGSQDETGFIARHAGVGVLRHDAPLGPARARNAGVAECASEVILFVDADVVVHPDVRVRLEAHFAADPDLAAVIGSYDAAPPVRTVVSRYRNLPHHFTHQQARREAKTFWTGLGAARRAAFLSLGGLDRAWENIEDVEFGLRVTAAGGAIRLDPDILGTHLKAWTVRSMFLTDLRGRALPWARLLLAKRAELGELNTSMANRVAAASVALAVLTLCAAPLFPTALWGTSAALLLFLGASAAFLRAIARIEGPLFAIRVLPLHALHYMAGLAGYALAWLERTARLGSRS